MTTSIKLVLVAFPRFQGALGKVFSGSPPTLSFFLSFQVEITTRAARSGSAGQDDWRRPQSTMIYCNVKAMIVSAVAGYGGSHRRYRLWMCGFALKCVSSQNCSHCQTVESYFPSRRTCYVSMSSSLDWYRSSPCGLALLAYR